MIDKRLLKETKRVRHFLALTVFLGIITAITIILQASLFARIVDGVFLKSRSLQQVWPLLLTLLGIILVRGILTWGSEVSAHRAASHIKESLRLEILQHIFALGPIHARGERTGELVNLLVEGIESLEDYFARYIPQLVLAASIPLLILVVVFPIDFTSGLILFFTAPLIPVFMILIGKWADHLTKRQWDSLSRMSAHFLDVLQGLTTLKIFGRSKSQAKVVGRISDEFRKTTLGVLRIAFLSALVLEMFSTISTALVAVALGLRLVYDKLPFEQAFFLLLLAPEFYLPLRQLGAHFHAGMSGTQAAQRIYEILAKPLSKNEREGTPWQAPDCLEVRFQGVHYQYDSQTSALQNLSLTLRAGVKVALVGPSGAGKTTVANLLLRFIEPSQGNILVNNTPLQQIPLEQWYQQVAYVSQNPYLFYGTVEENIRLGRPEATVEQVVAAAKQAGAHEFIEELERGYQTQIGEQGVRLSGGQAQRLAIARAILKEAPLVILDEATIGLDLATQRQIQESLDYLLQGRTTLIIAHRLTTVYQADVILVLDQGKVVEMGQHQELMQQRGLYYQLVQAYRGEVSL